MNTRFKILPMPDQPNVNGLIHTADEMDRAISSLRKKVDPLQIPVTSSLPHGVDVNIMDIIAFLTNIEYVPDEHCYYGTIRPIESPLVEFLSSKYENEPNLYLLMNKTGIIAEHDQKKYVDALNILSFTLSTERSIYFPH